MRVIQINLQHSKAATAVLQNQLLNDQVDIALIQEPYIVRGRVRGLEAKGVNVFYDSAPEAPRTCIAFNNDLKLQPLLEYSSKDLTTVSLMTEGGECGGEICVSSAYLPYDSVEPATNSLLDRLTKSCLHNHKQLIVGMDANAHNTVWGSSDTNARGELLIEYLSANNLIILNRGNVPTFFNGRRSEVIDITVGTQLVGELIEDWKVSDEPSLSDHRQISFIIKSLSVQASFFKNLKKTNWNLFKESLEGKLESVNVMKINNVGDLEAVNEAIHMAFSEAHNIACPPVMRRSNRQVPWFTAGLAKLRKSARRLFNKAKKTGDWASYKEALSLYNNALRGEKQKSWINICEAIEETPACARLHKLLAKEPKRHLGSMKKPDGTYTETRNEVMVHLLQSHFPGSTVLDSEEPPSERFPLRRCSKEDWKLIREIITPEKIRWAIFSFKPYKSPGYDGIFPAMLQHGPPILLGILCKLFRTVLGFGYIPMLWRKVKVIFIPKPGKQTYDQAKSFRPISLTSFLLKTMEKLVDRYIREEVLTKKPLHRHQYAYQPGKSTTLALHDLVTMIEKAMEQKEVALGAFIDIEGAFDNAAFRAIEVALRERHVNETIIRWVVAMLSSRMVYCEMWGLIVWILVTRGCPQGGVLSPLMWDLVVDALLEILNRNGFYTQGYADDITILIRGKFNGTISDRMNLALKLVQNWCERVELRVNPAKTIVVPFTRKTKLEDLRPPTLSGQVIRFSDEVKYLGVILDKRLTWNNHLERQINRAKMSLWTCRGLAGKKWGLNPKMMYWLYVTMVRPIITYGAIVWWNKLDQITACIKLERLQRMACLMITGAMKTAPTKALETVLNLAPLNIYVEAEARSTAYRIIIDKGQGTFSTVGHSQILSRVESEPIMGMIPDYTTTKYLFNQNFVVEIPDREKWSGGITLEQHADIWYTDGSKTSFGTGAGIHGHRPKANYYFSLGKYATVFQAEVFGILRCAQIYKTKPLRGKLIYILSDSQAALKALNAYQTKSKLVWECFNELNLLGNHNTVKLLWVPGHKGFLGNELADKLANIGSSKRFIGPEPSCGIPYCLGKMEIQKWTIKAQNVIWKTSSGMAHTKHFIDKVSRKITSQLLEMGRNRLRLTIGLITGHCELRKHLHLLKLVSSPTCRFCGEMDETPLHLLTDCKPLARKRLGWFSRPFPGTKVIADYPLAHTLNFIISLGVIERQ